MPIGTVDYVSSAPWNDPYNPWPTTTQVLLSSNNEPLLSGDFAGIADFTIFNPANLAPGSVIMQFSGNASPLNLYYTLSGNTPCWIIGFTTAIVKFYLPTTSRSLPVKLPGSSAGWILGDYADPAATVQGLVITPVLSSPITPWEYRRRRLLEYI